MAMSKSLLISTLLVFFLGCQSKIENQKEQVFVEEAENISKISESENYAKQIILACSKKDISKVDSLVKWIIDFKPGGVYLKKWPIEAIQQLAENLDTLMEDKPLFFADYFEHLEVDPYPIWGTNKYFHDSIFLRSFKLAGINGLLIPESIFKNLASNEYFQNAKNQKIISPTYYFNPNHKDVLDYQELAIVLQKNKGFLWLDSINIDSLPYQQIKNGLSWKGLVIANPIGNHLSHLQAGADMVVVSNRSLINKKGYKQNQKSKNAYENISSYLKKQPKNQNNQISASALLKSTQLHFSAKSTVVFNKTHQLLPLSKYEKIPFENLLAQVKPKKHQLVVIPKTLADSTIKNLAQSKSANQTLFVFSNPNQFEYLSNLPFLIFNHMADLSRNSIFTAQIQGHLPINGNLLVKNKLVKGKKLKGKGLSYVPPEFVFLDGKKFYNINTFVKEAINGKAFPGCQIFAIKDEVVIYNKAFGHTDYQRNFAVNQQHIYDLASLTKVLATTLVAMKLWEDGHFKLEESIGKYLPDSLSKSLPQGSSIRNITFQELLVHQSGLPAGFPVIEYMRKAADLDSRFSNGFCDYPYENFQIEVADELFLENCFQDSMWLTLNSLWLDPSKKYRYSDVNMNTLYFILKRIIEQNQLAQNSRYSANAFENYLYKYFFTPLRMITTRYQPLKQFPKKRIVPTENDRFWRKQLLQGHVHDPNAALYGGVAGNAGLFSSASDIGNLLSMWQHNGVFEGKRYLKAETIQKFIETQPNSHRGLGFNKRTFTNAAYSMASSADQSSYGHTGFTGTCFWVDPVNNISYIFLSNRVHPKVTNKIYEFNIRTRVHQVFYDALLK